MTKHILYKTTDVDKPKTICDSNGEVVLAECRICGGAEAAMPTVCPGRKLTSDELDQIQNKELDFIHISQSNHCEER